MFNNNAENNTWREDKINRVGKGESHPQTSHRTALEPLDSHGSSQ